MANEVLLGDSHPLTEDIYPLKVGGDVSSLEISKTGSGAKVSGDLEVDGNVKIYAPSVDNDAATKKYVDDNAGGTAYHYQMHQWYATSTDDIYVPFGGSTVESTYTTASLYDDTFWIAPFAGKLIRAYLFVAAGTDTTDIQLRVNGVLGSSVLSGGTVEVSTATVATFTCDQNNTFSAGDYVNVYLVNEDDPRQATMTTVWEVD